MPGAVAVDWDRTYYQALVNDRTEYERFVDSCMAATPESTQPSADVARLRRSCGIVSNATAQDFQDICDRMAARAAQPVEEVAPVIGQDIPHGCPIITSPKPVTRSVRFKGRTFTAAEVNRASLEHRNREQARFVAEFVGRAERRQAPKATETRKARRSRKHKAREQAKAEARAMKNDGLTVPQIKERLGVSRATVFRWLREGDTT